MSLRDTIEGARDEAKSTVDAMTKKTAADEKDKAKEGDAPAAYDPFKSGKATAAGAKPSREAAASVTMEGERPKKNVALMTQAVGLGFEPQRNHKSGLIERLIHFLFIYTSR